jgi:hypothetical protein
MVSLTMQDGPFWAWHVMAARHAGGPGQRAVLAEVAGDQLRAYPHAGLTATASTAAAASAGRTCLLTAIGRRHDPHRFLHLRHFYSGGQVTARQRCGALGGRNAGRAERAGLRVIVGEAGPGSGLPHGSPGPAAA